MIKTAPPEQNSRGNLIFRAEEADSHLSIPRGESRYHYDCNLGPDWQQYDTKQDAWYFGVWVDTKGRRVFSYCEGDRTLVECPSKESLSAELTDMEQFYGPQPPALIACTDIGFHNGKIVPGGDMTCYYDKRPSAADAH